MAKRMQEQKEEERSVAKSKSTAMNLSSHIPASSSRRNSKSDAASRSQVRLQDAYLGGLMDTATGKPVATKEESGNVDLSESETGSGEDVTGRPVPCKQLLGNPMHPVNQTTREVQKLKEKNGHTIHTCLQPQFNHTEAVFSIVRRIYGREDPMDYLEVNIAIWCRFLNAI